MNIPTSSAYGKRVMATIENNAVPFSEKMQTLRKLNLWSVITSRRFIRAMLRYQSQLRDRLKLLPPAQTGRFRHHQSIQLRHEIQAHLSDIRASLVSSGRHLVTRVYPFIDKLCSQHDKAQLLGVHHIHVERLAADIGSDNMSALILHHIECTDTKAPFVTGGEQMPLWEAQSALFQQYLLDNPDVGEHLFNEFLASIPPAEHHKRPDLSIVE